MIGSTSEKWEIGKRYVVSICRQHDEPYVTMPVLIIREATFEEYRDWHVNNGLRYDPRAQKSRANYYEISID